MSLREDYLGSPFLAFSTTLHASAGFKTRSKRISLPDNQSYRLTQRAKTCTTTRAQHSHIILQREEHLTPTIPQSPALACGLSNFYSTFSQLRTLVLLS